MISPPTDQRLPEHTDLVRRLEEAEDALRAIRSGEVDAVLVQAEREQVYTLETADKPYRLLVEQMPQGAATITPEGAILYCNHRFADLVKRPQRALPGQRVHDLVAPESRPCLDALLQDGRTAEAQGEVTLERVDGRRVPVYLGVSALQEGALGLCLVITDLTEQRHYRELRRAQQALREAEQRKDEFLATLAHELRNPLAPIRNALEVLKLRGPADPELQWGRNVIDRQVQVMARLLDDLLDVSRIARNKLELRTECLDLTQIIEISMEMSRPLVEAGGHQLVVSRPPEPIYVEGDAVRLAQVFANLLTNAAKYTDRGGRIELTLSRQEQAATVAVRDNGIGIATETMPHLFDIFSQAQPALPRAQGGLGIGLSLVKGLVALHGGRVEAFSEGPGRGSEFVVTLPTVAPPPPARARRTDSETPVGGHRILIVDDNRDSTDSLAMLLRLTGNEVSTAYDGEQAIEAAAALRPEVILLDINMPKRDGYECCRCIRAQPWGRDVFLIALTGWGQEEDRRRAEEAGFNHHMVKPVSPEELTALLASLAQK